MKKVLAIILTVVMLFGVIAISTSADTTTPTVTIVTNEGSPVAEGVDTYFTVRFDNFSVIKGVDVTVSANQNIVLGEVEAYGFKNSAGLNVNYTEDNDSDVHTIRFVDLTAGGDAHIVFAAKVPKETNAPEDPTITVTGKYADSGKTLFEVEAPAAGKFELVKEVVTTTVETQTTITAPTDKFIPVGGIYTGTSDNPEFVNKNDDGSFTAPAGAVYQTYDVPANGITTFGASDDPVDPKRLRFGNYSKINDGAKERGTLIFEGDWLALKNYYIKNGYTVQQFVAALYNDVTAKLAANQNATHVYYNLDGERINVYRFVQKKHLWKSTDGTVIEYSIRLDGIQDNTTYTGVAYSIAGDDKVTISEDVKSVTRKAEAQQ